MEYEDSTVLGEKSAMFSTPPASPLGVECPSHNCRQRALAVAFFLVWLLVPQNQEGQKDN